MTCRYVFSRKEYIRAVNLNSWFRLPKTLFFIGLLAAFFAYVAWSGLRDPEEQAKIPSTEPMRTNYIIGYYLSFAPVVLIPAVLILPPVWTYLNYLSYRRRGTFAGKQLTYHFGEDGIQLEADTFRQANAWDFLGRAREGRHGFLLNWGKSATAFHWVPKSSFEKSGDIEEFRKLLGQHVANFK